MKKFSIIIIARNREECAKAVNSSTNLNHQFIHEIIITLGNKPSVQRNTAAMKATGEYLLFLDNDSIVDSLLLDKYNEVLVPDSVGVAGGPSINHNLNSNFKYAANLVLTSIIGLGPFRHRYQSSGKTRRATERDLILCNLVIKRRLFIENGGFSRHLYPNEENELLNRLIGKTEMIYHPQAICYREPRSSFKEFSYQFFSYGAGRAKHHRPCSSFSNLIFTLPSIFSIYFLSLPVLAFFSKAFLLPAMVYFIFCFIESIMYAAQTRHLLSVIYGPMLFWSCHFFYGVGFAFVGLRRACRFLRNQIEVLSFHAFR